MSNELAGFGVAALLVLIFIVIGLLLAALYYGVILYALLTVLKWFGIIHLIGVVI